MGNNVRGTEDRGTSETGTGSIVLSKGGARTSVPPGGEFHGGVVYFPEHRITAEQPAGQEISRPGGQSRLETGANLTEPSPHRARAPPVIEEHPRENENFFASQKQRRLQKERLTHNHLAQERSPERKRRVSTPRLERHRNIEMVEELLRELPVETPEQVNKAKEILSLFLKIKGGAAEGIGADLPPIASLAVNVMSLDGLVSKLKKGQYYEAAKALISVGEDAATTASWFIDAAVKSGAISAASRLGRLGARLGRLGGRLGSRGFGLSLTAFEVMWETLKIPSDNEDKWKVLFIADVSGILTSWIFNDDAISPHSRLRHTARRFGLYNADLSDAVTAARSKAEKIWRENFKDRPEVVRKIREESGGDYRVYWRRLGEMLDLQLQTKPPGYAPAFIGDLIDGVEERRRERRRRQMRPWRGTR